MNEQRLLWVLVMPSLSSGIVTVVVSLAISLFSAWLYVSHNPAFYDYLFGPYGISTSLLQLPDASAVLRTWLFGSRATYYVVLAVTAIIAGLTVLTILQGVQFIIHKSEFVWREVRTAAQAQKSVIRELFARLTLRVLACIAWGIYIAIFITIMLPFAVALQQNGIDAMSSDILGGSAYIVASFAFIVIALHVHVVFARLVALRPRLYGENDIELAVLK